MIALKDYNTFVSHVCYFTSFTFMTDFLLLKDDFRRLNGTHVTENAILTSFFFDTLRKRKSFLCVAKPNKNIEPHRVVSCDQNPLNKTRD